MIRNLCHAHRYADEGTDDNTVEEGCFHILRNQYSTNQNTDDSEESRRGEFTQGNKSSLAGCDDTCVLQPDKGYNHTAPRRDGMPQILRYAVEYDLPDIEKGDQNKDDTLNQHNCKSRLP